MNAVILLICTRTSLVLDVYQIPAAPMFTVFL
uniref:Uncharacterized protein n=1 Tax=Arundo donax TaxID=35708 RepID=A0A0A9C986_ARUDO